MRVDDPMLSIVATCRNALRRSGDRVCNASHRPLNSSISAIDLNTSCEIPTLSIGVLSFTIPANIPDYTRFRLDRFGVRPKLACQLLTCLQPGFANPQLVGRRGC